MSMFPELERQSFETLQRSFLNGNGKDKISKDDRALWLEEVAAHIARTGNKGIEFLLEKVVHLDEDKTRAALTAFSLEKHLSKPVRNKVCECIEFFLKDPRPLVVADAIDALRLLGCEQCLGPIVWLIRHRSPYVVGSVLRYLTSVLDDKAAPILMHALKSRHSIIRQNAIDELDALAFAEALPRIRELLTDSDDNVRLAALAAVKNLEEVAH